MPGKIITFFFRRFLTKKQKKLGFLALIGLVALASIFTVCKASGTNNIYAAPQWKVTFDTGGGLPEPKPNPVTVADGETIGKMPEVDPAKDGFSFGGWYLGNSGFDPGMPITRDITVPAKWIGPAKEGHYHVTFKGAGGSPDTYVEENVIDGGTIDPLPGVKRTGYTFVGWYPAASETEFTASTPVTRAITLFAKWTDITYTVSYNAGNGGTGSMDPSTHTYGVPKRLSAISTGTISNAGHEFKGWAKSAGSTQWQYDDNEEVINLADTQGAVVPLYAVWTRLYDGIVRDASTKDLMVKFGVKTAPYAFTDISTDDVSDTFNQVSAYMKKLPAQDDLRNGAIALGDYIDLHSLDVAAYPSGGTNGALNVVNKAITPATLPFTGYDGALLRLIVVGRNSFKSGPSTNIDEDTAHPTAGTYIGGGEGSEKAHLVFQFQNIPVAGWFVKEKEQGVDNPLHYLDSALRRYLVKVESAPLTINVGFTGGYAYEKQGAFLTGLVKAGVPEKLLWAPERTIALWYKGRRDSSRPPNKVYTATIKDKVWVPTRGEMTSDSGGQWVQGSGDGTGNGYGYIEGPVNQAWLEYYPYVASQAGNSTKKPINAYRIKYNDAGTAKAYWTASIFPDYFWYFTTITTAGAPDKLSTGSMGGNADPGSGIAPAFCVSY